MIRSLRLLAIPLLLGACASSSHEAATGLRLPPPLSDGVSVGGLDDLQAALASARGRVLVVNYWATWCQPCRDEMPAFVRLAKESSPDDLAVLGVSADFVDEVESQVIPFKRSAGMTFPVLVYNGDPESMINAVHPRWQGDLPATAIYSRNGDRVAFHAGTLTWDELKALVDGALGG